jgi:hypothetical protein
MSARLGLILFASLLYGQAVEGLLSNSVTHAPIPSITVTLAGPATYTAISDATGAFRFASVQTGDYTLRIEARGFQQPRETRKLLHVSDATTRIAIELEPLARLQGRVLFADGRPAPRSVVWLVFYPEGGMFAHGAGDDGRFIFDVPSGTYVLRARAAAGEKSADAEVWAPTYFPNAAGRGQAEPIRLRPGADLSGYEIRLRSVPAIRVTGVVRDEAGDPVAGAAIQLMEADARVGPEKEIRSGEDGTFEFSAVWPGGWTLQASSRQGDVTLKGFASATVTRRDIDRLDIRLARPFTLRGLVDRREPRDEKGERKVTGVVLIPVEPQQAVNAFHQQDGSIAFANVYPGRYYIQPVGVVPGYYLESVRLGDREVLGQTVELFEGSPPLRVTYQADAPRVRGTVKDGEGCTAVLVPQEDVFLNEQFIRSAQAGAGGRFEIGGLRPGDYYAFAFDRVDWASLQTPAFVHGLSSRAEKVHVEKGESAAISLKVTHWPE